MSKTRSKFDFVEVTWHDACSSQGWVTMGSLPDLEVVISRGWMVAKDKRRVTLAASMDRYLKASGEIGEVITIPRGMIESVRVIEKATQKG